MGEPPLWYRVVKAAQFLKVPPWELAERPVYWLEVSEAAQDAEAYSAKMHEKATPGKG